MLLMLTKVPIWDTVLHLLTGIVGVIIAYKLIEKNIKLNKILVVVLAFCFSMTIGVLWEVLEYSTDKIILSDMQQDRVIDTISSLTIRQKKSEQAITVRGINKTILYNKNGEELFVIEQGYLDIGLNDTMKDLNVNLIGALVSSFVLLFYLSKKKVV